MTLGNWNGLGHFVITILVIKTMQLMMKVTIYIIYIMMKSGFVCLKNRHFLELHQDKVLDLFRDVSKNFLTSKYYDPARQVLPAIGAPALTMW